MFTLTTLAYMGVAAVCVITVVAASIWHAYKIDELTREPIENEFDEYR